VSHETLDRIDGLFRVGDRLAFGDVTDEAFAGFAERHDGRGGAMPFRIGNDGGLTAFHDGDAAVGGTEVDSDDFGHCGLPVVAGDSAPLRWLLSIPGGTHSRAPFRYRFSL